MSFGTFDEIAQAAASADQFEGEITIDEEVDDNFNADRTRWHYGITPAGSEKTIQAWYNNGARGQAAQAIASLRKHIPADELKGKKPGQGALLGIRGVFERKTFTYTDRESGERKESRNPTIVMVKYIGRGAPTASYSETDVVAMLGLVDGRKPAEYQRQIMKNEILSNQAKIDILDGKALDWLVAEGYATRDAPLGGLRATDKAVSVEWMPAS